MPRGYKNGAPARPPNKVMLTEKMVNEIEPEAKARNLWDIQEPGLVLRVQPSGHRAFKFVCSVNGRANWNHLGQIDLASARRIAAELRVKVAEKKTRLGFRLRKPGNPGRPSFVYFIKIGAAVKIGTTVRLDHRLSGLQAGTSEKIELLTVIPGGRELERKLHLAFGHARLSGEFFELEVINSFLRDLSGHLLSVADPKAEASHRRKGIEAKPHHHPEREDKPIIVGTNNSKVRLLCQREVTDLVGLSYDELKAQIRAGTFPHARQVSKMKVAWLSNEISAWIQSAASSKEASKPPKQESKPADSG